MTVIGRENVRGDSRGESESILGFLLSVGKKIQKKKSGDSCDKFWGKEKIKGIYLRSRGC